METKALSLIATKAIPGLMSESLTYNYEKDVLLTLGYTSAAGNTYYRAIRGTNGIVIVFDLGQGYWYTFLNGISIYGFDGNKPRLIAKKQWGGCDNWIAFSEMRAKQHCINMLSDFLQSEAKMLRQPISLDDARSFATDLIDQTYCKRIA